jgi:hypothetical protein
VDSNVERTRKRDIVFCDIFRLPSKRALGCGYLRSQDLDPTLWCAKCAMPLMMVEAVRGYAYKATRYTETVAGGLLVPAFLMRRDGEDDLASVTKITVIRLDGRGEQREFTASTFGRWGEDVMRWHMARVHPGVRA